MTSNLNDKLFTKIDDKIFIFDFVRKKYIKFTKEEYVRQSIIYLLHKKYEYPLAFMQIEKKISKNILNQRADIVIRNKQMQTMMLVECKAYDVAIDSKTFSQVLNYNFILDSHLVLITNGIINLCYQGSKQNGYKILNHIPMYQY